MFLLNLSLGEFLALFAIASTAVVALYMLDRARRKVTVAMLRFWTAGERPVESPRRRRIQQWPSLLLQLIAMACLLLAMGRLRLGSRDDGSRDHVLIVDRSAWMGASAGNGTLLDGAKAQALAYLRAIPPNDRVMLVAADAMATPLTPFETDRGKIEAALGRMRASYSGLDLGQALRFARAVQKESALRPGEIVYAGAGRLSRDEAMPGPEELPELRVLAPRGDPGNVGLRKVGAQRSATEPDRWTFIVAARNYGSKAAQAELALQFSGAPAGGKKLLLAAGSEQEATFEFRTRAAGLLEVRIRSAGDGFAGDDRAVLELPAAARIQVTACSDDPALLRPLLEAHANLVTSYYSRTACPRDVPAGIRIFDGFVPDPFPAPVNAILIDPPKGNSPIAIRASAYGVRLTSWAEGEALAAGIRTQDLRLERTQIFDALPGDVRVAESEAGPVVVARSSAEAGMLAAIGFHPMRGPLRFDLATPLLFANIVRWMAPDSFRSPDLYTDNVGSVTAPLEPGVDRSAVRVLNARGEELPFTIGNGQIGFFAGAPGAVRVETRNSEQVHSLTLPEVGETVWRPPARARRGIPAQMALTAASSDVWQWLALAAAALLVFEWFRYAPRGVIEGRQRKGGIRKLPRMLRNAS